MTKQTTDISIRDLEAIPVTKLLKPRMPIDTFIQEAHDLQVWMEEDHDALMGVGLSEELLTELPRRIELLIKAEALWNQAKNTQSKTQEAWRAWKTQVIKLRSELKKAFKFAFRMQPELLKTIQPIGIKRSNAQLVQDLSDLSVLGKANVELLTAIGFDLALLDQATQWSAETAKRLAKHNNSSMTDREERLLRDKAYTYLKESVDQIQTAGKYVFHANPDKRRGYSSQYG